MKRYKLRELLTIKNGFDHKKLDNGKYPAYGSGGIMRYVNSYLYDKESVLLPRKGTLSNIQYANEPFWTIDTMYYTELKSEIIDAYYLYRYLSLPDLSGLDTGTGVPSMTFNSYYDIEVEIPNLTTQRKIAAVLKAIDDKIALNDKINALLERLARAVYDYYFVQFDFKNERGKPYKSSGGAMIFNPTLNRPIPATFEVQNLNSNSLTRLIQPGILAFEGEKIYLPTANIQNDKIVDFSNKITHAKRESRANMQPKANSVWFAKMKNSKKVLYFGDYSQEWLDKLILSTGLCGLQCEAKSLEYIWCFVNSAHFEILKDKLAHGATQEAVNNDDLLSIPLLIPADEVLSDFHKFTKPIFEQKYKNELESASLKALRDFLLPLLMSAQARVE